MQKIFVRVYDATKDASTWKEYPASEAEKLRRAGVEIYLTPHQPLRSANV